MKKNIRIIVCNIMVILINIMFFSNKFIGMDINSNDVVNQGITQTIIFFSIAVLIYVNGRFIYEIILCRMWSLHIKDKFKEAFSIDKQHKANKINKQDINNKTQGKYIKSNIKDNDSDNTITKLTLEKYKREYIKRLKHIKNKKLFGEDIKYIRGQIWRISKKEKVLNEIIGTRFKHGNITYNRLSESIKEIESIFYFNIFQIVHKLEACDEKEFLRTDNNVDRKLEQQINRVYLAYKDGIKQGISDNDQILIKLDELIIEFSRLVGEENNFTDTGMPRAIQKIDELIQISRYYK